MQCTVCGQEYGLAHSCAGIAPLTTPEETAPAPGLRFAPIHYLGEAGKILCWDDAAVRRASRDNNSLLYGLLILVIAPALPLGLMTLRNVGLGYPVPWSLLLRGYTVAFFFGLVWIILQIGLAHLLAKVMFDAKGTYIAIMRAFLLGQLYQWLGIVPMIGGIISGIGGIAVLMLVFEEVDGIERMKAFGLAAAIGVGFWILSIWAITSRVHPAR